MNEAERLQKEVERLTEALAKAHRLQEGLEADKDNAFKLLQIMVYKQSPQHIYVIEQADLIRYDPRRWVMHQRREPDGNLRLQVLETGRG